MNFSRRTMYSSLTPSTISNASEKTWPRSRPTKKIAPAPYRELAEPRQFSVSDARRRADPRGASRECAIGRRAIKGDGGDGGPRADGHAAEWRRVGNR